jgi:diguanylate cyclase (GGDEF)-like protein
VCMLTFTRTNKDDYKYGVMTDNDYTELTDWTLENDNSTVTLPTNFSYTGDKIVLSKVIDYDGEFNDVPYMMIVMKYYDYTIYLDDEPIFTYTNSNNSFTTTNGTQVRMIRLGNDIKGKTLRMEMTPLFKNHIKYYIGAPCIGSKADILWKSFKNDLWNFILDIGIISFGIIILIMCFVMRKTKSRDKMFYLGILSLTCGLYMGCQYRLTHMLVKDSYVIYYLEYSVLNIIPIVVAKFLDVNVNQGLPKKVCGIMRYVVIANIVVQNVLNFAFGISFKEMLWITHIIIILLALTVIAIIVMQYKEKNIMNMMLSCIPPMLGGVADLVLMYAVAKEKTVMFFPIGLYIFVAIQAVYTFQQYSQVYKKQLENDIYKKLAFTDGLTGLYNRLAFENDINTKIEDEDAACISIDINNLKTANDTMGHSAGDVLIKGIAEILTEAVGKIGKVYRIGGDEFVILLENVEHADVDALLCKIERCKKAYNKKNEIPIDFAIGMSYNNDEDVSFEKIVLRADKLMYKNKREAKLAYEK